MVDLIRPKPFPKGNVKVFLNSIKRINYAKSSKLWFVTEIYPTVVYCYHPNFKLSDGSKWQIMKYTLQSLKYWKMALK